MIIVCRWDATILSLMTAEVTEYAVHVELDTTKEFSMGENMIFLVTTLKAKL